VDLKDALLAGLKGYFGLKAIGSAIDHLGRTPPSGAFSKATEQRSMRMKKYSVRTLDERVSHIIRMTKKGRDDPEFRKIVSQILTRKCGRRADGQTIHCVPEKNWEAEVATIFYWVRNHVRYTRDTHNIDVFQHPLRTLQLGIGDCDDVSSLLGAILLAAGYGVVFRVIRTTQSNDWDHIFVIVEIPRSGHMVLPITAVVPKRGWIEAPYLQQNGTVRKLDARVYGTVRKALDASVDRPAGWHPPKSMIAATRDFRV
jgi:hypothetical protein